jgi:hypothetical protein
MGRRWIDHEAHMGHTRSRYKFMVCGTVKEMLLSQCFVSLCAPYFTLLPFCVLSRPLMFKTTSIKRLLKHTVDKAAPKFLHCHQLTKCYGRKDTAIFLSWLPIISTQKCQRRWNNIGAKSLFCLAVEDRLWCKIWGSHLDQDSARSSFWLLSVVKCAYYAFYYVFVALRFIVFSSDFCISFCFGTGRRLVFHPEQEKVLIVAENKALRNIF